MTTTNGYQQGKVYKLISSKNDDIYIGSTCSALSRRFYEHKQKAKVKPLPAHKYFNEIGWDKVSFILIEDIPCDNRNQLVREEQRHIDLLKPVLNKKAAFVFCPHGKKHHRCKECCGASICEHGRIKAKCKECGGASICEHNRDKAYCRDCGGRQICKHNKNKSRCKECGGAAICEHGRQKSSCKDCKGGSICEHNKRKSECKDCKGSSICLHNKNKSHCKACAGDKYKCSICDKLYCSNKSLMTHYLTLKHQQLVEANNEEEEKSEETTLRYLIILF